MLEHGILVAGSGHGKTQALGAIIASYLDDPNPPGMLIVDFTGVLVQQVQNLAVFCGRLKERLIVVDPAHDLRPH